jgi:glycosyltransferase involved in cell wall biosynthesis
MQSYSHITSESQWGIERSKELVPQASTHLWDYAANQLFYNGTRHLSPTPTCLIAGTNTPVKNVTCAIEAFSRPELSHITLYLAGIAEGQYEKLPHNIIPLGRLNREALKEKLSTVWCLVHPSLADTCPNIVKEARVMGVPCVVTTECGAKQYVIHEKSGYIIPVKNSEALAKAVLKITESEETSLRMGAYDHERCREDLSAKTMMNKLFALYEQVLAE